MAENSGGGGSLPPGSRLCIYCGCPLTPSASPSCNCRLQGTLAFSTLDRQQLPTHGQLVVQHPEAPQDLVMLQLHPQSEMESHHQHHFLQTQITTTPGHLHPQSSQETRHQEESRYPQEGHHEVSRNAVSYPTTGEEGETISQEDVLDTKSGSTSRVSENITGNTNTGNTNTGTSLENKDQPISPKFTEPAIPPTPTTSTSVTWTGSRPSCWRRVA